MKIRSYFLLVIFTSALLLLIACAPQQPPEPTAVPTQVFTTAAPTNPPTVPPPTATPTKTPRPVTPTPEQVPVSVEALVGDWARVLTSGRDPEKFGHYWLRVHIDGAFALTTNKKQFDTNVDHLGTFVFDGQNLIFTAAAGSTKCVGQSATYQPVLYSDGTLEFLIIDVPCSDWLNMGAGALGEGTIWVRLPSD